MNKGIATSWSVSDQAEIEENEVKRKNKASTWESLSVLLETLIGEVVSVELKSDKVLGKATQQWIEGRWRGRRDIDMELVFLSSRMIRYVHIPSSINLDAHIRRWQKRKQAVSFRRNYITDRHKRNFPVHQDQIV
mmetsp:Transcript_5510/g.6460  ORF Transcript_5510/g.6460 Transcript_5510/m.6460 type:complete len:135 (+) Transcript_5510:218-622(+)